VNRKHIRFVLHLLPLLTALAFAQSSPDVSDAAPPAKPDVANGKLRDPFWPVGYLPRVEMPATESPAPVVEKEIPWPPLVLKGITEANGRYSAIIEGIGFVESGDIVTRKTNRLAYRWKINSITKTSVSHTKLDVRAADE